MFSSWRAYRCHWPGETSYQYWTCNGSVINQVNDSPCGDIQIHSTEFQEQQQSLLIFLKGSQRRERNWGRKSLRSTSIIRKYGVLNGNTKSVLYQHSTFFFLVCCFGTDCPHPLCQSGKPPCKMEWFAGGPSLQTIPSPVADPSRPWRNPNCESCCERCAGMFVPLHEVTGACSICTREAIGLPC